MQLTADSCPDLNLQFVMSDWLAEDQIRGGTIYWVLDSTAELRDIRIALQHGIPMLVPEQAQALKEVCIEGNCGLFYQNLEEAVACLTYLVRHPAVRAVLSDNARRFLEPGRPP
jgi:hypothetical protein